MLTPAYKLTIGSKVVKPLTSRRPAPSLTSRSALDLDTPGGEFTFDFGNVGNSSPKRDDKVKVELGYADNGGFTQVMKGTVETSVPNLTTTRLPVTAGRQLPAPLSSRPTKARRREPLSATWQARPACGSPPPKTE